MAILSQWELPYAMPLVQRTQYTSGLIQAHILYVNPLFLQGVLQVGVESPKNLYLYKLF